MPGEGQEVFAAFMDLEMAYNTVDQNGLWDVPRICVVGDISLKGLNPSIRAQVPLCE